MGLEDREYLRDEARRYDGGDRYSAYGQTGGGGPKRIVTIIVIICVVLYLIDAFTPPIRFAGQIVSNQFFDILALKSEDVFSSKILSEPWNMYQLISYGFAHASMSTQRSLWHIFGNMLALWMLGRFVEDRLGRMEFLVFYLAAILFSALVWGVFHINQPGTIIGASGGVVAVVILFAFMFPNVKVYLFGVLEIPGWVVGLLVVGQDLLLALNPENTRVAYQAHLGGAAFGAMYHLSGFRFLQFRPVIWISSLFSRRPRLRVHSGDDPQDDLAKETEMADRILEKVHREGESSLTRKERKFLQRYSKKVRDRNRQ